MMPSSSGSTCKVTGEKAGSVTISCTVKWQTYDSTTGLYVYASSNKKTQTYSVIVQAADDTTPTSISLNYTSISLEVGNTRQLSATVSPSGASQSVTWSVVSGSGVASVSSSGLVTALATGTATIRATSSAKSSVYKDCTVTVIQTTPPTSISLNYTSISLTEGNTRQLTATVSPSGASQSVTWSVYSGSNYASVSSSGLVTAKLAGMATIRATSTSNSSIYKDCTVTVTEPVLTPGTWSGNTVTIGDNATSSTSKAPYNNYWTYSTTQMLYSPAEIGKSGTINSIAFKVASASSFAPTALKVYLGHKSSLFSSTTDYMTSSNLTLVYDGTPTLGASSGWETLTFNKGTFDYNGTDNLVVVVAMKSSNYDTTLGYYCYTGSGYVLSHGSDDTTGYGDITNTSYGYSTSTERPSIRLGFGQSQSGTTGTGIEINATNFPDANFRSYLLSQSYGSDGILTQDEINGITSLYVYSKQIGNLKGIEYFTALTTLKCWGNQLTTLDVSQNTALEILDCSDNQLTTLDVSKNTALEILHCSSNQLTTLDVSQNTALTELWCYDNQLTTLDVSQNTALTDLRCFVNQLTTLDVSQNTALTELYCDYNQLTTLDVSQNTALTELYCDYNQLTTLDVSQNTALTKLWCYDNQLTTLDVSNNMALTMLSCDYNQLTTLDVSQNTALEILYCEDNQLTTLDVSQNTALETLGCYRNYINGVNMDNLIAGLRQNSTDNCRICVIDVSGSNEEGNVCTKAQVAAIKAKGWKPLYTIGNMWQNQEYEGSEEVLSYSDGDTFSATNSDGLTLEYYVISAADKTVCALSASKSATHITIPAEVNGYKVIEIGASLAQSNEALESVVIPEGVTSIQREAFLGCISLTSLYIPASVTSIKPSSFHGCINLREVVVADDNPVYDSRENCNGIIETATNTLFFGNRNTVIPQSVTAIGSFSATGDVVIPSQITVIGEDAFMFMEGMTSVTIPAGVTAIGKYAFEDCSGLTSVTSLITSPFAIDESVFRNHGDNPSATLYVPVGTKALYEATAGWNQFPNIVEKEAEEEPQTIEVDGIYYKIAKASDALNGIEQTIYQSDVEVAVVCEAEKGHEYSGDIVIPSSITYDGKTYPVACVAECAFAEYKGWNGKEIRSVVIPNSVVAIGEEAFVESGTLRRVEIPNSVRYIGEDAFADCESLSEIVSYIQEPFEIQTNVFRNIANDATLYVPFGTKALYEVTVGWNGIANIVEMEPAEIVVTDISQLENAIYIEPLTSRVGTTVDLCVKMKNTLTPVGCSFKLTLPQGLRLQEDEYGDVVYEMGSRAKKMSVTMQDWDDGSYDFALTPSTATAIIFGNDDTFITFHVELPDDMEATDYALLLTRCLIQSRTDGMTKDFPLSNVTSRLTVEDYLMGDVNNDGSVTPSDAIMTLYNYFSVEQTGFNAKAADMNSDASITPADAIEMLYTYFGSGRQNVTRRNGDEREPQ